MTALTHAAPERRHLTLRETLADSRVMAARQLRKNLRRPTYIVFSFVQPVILVLLFRYVFGGARRPYGGGRRDERFTLIVMLLVGIAVGFRPSEPIYDIALALLLVLGFSYVFSWISAFVGLSVRDPETAQSAGFVWVFPLTFASSAFVPTSAMPGVVQAFADINPVTFAVDAVRSLMIGHGDVLGPGLGTLVWLVGLLLVFVPLSVRAFRRA
jgi:disulfide bond formation protein DsbB